MRRKKTTDLGVDAELLGVDALPPAPVDDPGLPYVLRKKQFELWLERRRSWVERREQHSAEHGWPGGDLARMREEDEAHPIPNAPFDPAWEIAHGGL